MIWMRFFLYKVYLRTDSQVFRIKSDRKSIFLQPEFSYNIDTKANGMKKKFLSLGSDLISAEVCVRMKSKFLFHECGEFSNIRWRICFRDVQCTLSMHIILYMTMVIFANTPRRNPKYSKKFRGIIGQNDHIWNLGSLFLTGMKRPKSNCLFFNF